MKIWNKIVATTLLLLSFITGVTSCSNNQTSNEAIGVNLVLNDEGVIEGKNVNIIVPNSVTEYSFINTFSFSSDYRWELHWDKSCLTDLNIVSKTIDLENGDNIVYALFINKTDSDDVDLYEICVHRIHKVEVSYAIINEDVKETFLMLQHKDYIDTLTDIELSYKPNSDEFSKGYKFSHYESEDFNEITYLNIKEDILVYIVETAKEYSITLDVNGGDNLLDSTININFNQSYSLPIPTRDDHEFIGWTLDGEALNNTGIWKIDRDVVIKAQWKSMAIEYTVNEDNLFSEDNLILSMIKIDLNEIKYVGVNDEGKAELQYQYGIKIDPSSSHYFKKLENWDINLIINFYVEINYSTGNDYISTNMILINSSSLKLNKDTNKWPYFFRSYGKLSIEQVASIVKSANGGEYLSVGSYSNIVYGAYGSINYFEK